MGWSSKKILKSCMGILLIISMLFANMPVLGVSAEKADMDDVAAFEQVRQEFFESFASTDEDEQLETIVIPDEPHIHEFVQEDLSDSRIPYSSDDEANFDPVQTEYEGRTWGPFDIGNERMLCARLKSGTSSVYKAVKGKLAGQGVYANVWILDDTEYHAAKGDSHIEGTCNLTKMTPSQAQNVANVIDGIYSRMTIEENRFGAHANVKVIEGYSNLPASGDIDEDGMMNFVLYPMSDMGLAGFFYSADFFTPTGSYTYSSYLDVVHVSIDGLLGYNPMYYYGTLAHEFQHFLFYTYFQTYSSINTTNGSWSWINESLADLAKIYYVQPNAVTSVDGRTSAAAKNPYSVAGNSYADFVNFNSLKSYGTGCSLSYFMGKKVGTSYAREIYKHFEKEYPVAKTRTEYSANSVKTSGKTMDEVWGNVVKDLGIGNGGSESFAQMYWMFMENFATDGGTIRGETTDVSTVKLFSDTSSSNNLWSLRSNNIDSTTISDGGAISLGGYGNGSPRMNATHEMFYHIPASATTANNVLNIRINDSGAGTQTKYYVALKREGTLPNADIYPLTPGVQKTINTNGKTAYLFAVTLYRQVNSTVNYTWSAPAYNVLTGTVTLSSYYPTPGTNVKATVSPTGAYNYKWTVDGTVVGTNSDTYTVTTADIGKTLKVIVTSATLTGSLETQTVLIQKSPNYFDPPAPTAASVAARSVTLVAIAGYEYSIDGVLWQDSPVFSQLLPVSTYTFYQRVKATDTTNASYSSIAANITTPDASYNITLSQTALYTFAAATYGYSTAPSSHSVTVTNTGEQSTGALTVALSGTNSTSFTLSKTSISSIASGGTDTFTVVPKLSLAAGTHTATVTVSGGNNISATFNISFTVNPKAITANVIVANKVYEGTTAATISSASLSGVVGTDAVAISTSYPTAKFDNATIGTGKPVTFSGNFTLTGAAASNYTLTQPTGVTANITAKALTINVVATKVYDGTNTATITSATLSGVVGTDSVTISTAYPTATFANAEVGTGKAVSFGGNFELLGAVYNYTLVQPTGVTGTITPKALSMNVTIADNVYDGTTAATISSAGLTGVVYPDSVYVSTPYPTATFASATAGNGKAVSFGGNFTLAGSSASNYTLTQPTGVTGNILDAVYGVSLSQSSPFTFTEATYGYWSQTPLLVTVTNSGNKPTGALTVALSGTNASSFTLSNTSINGIAEGSSDVFTVAPKSSLSAGTYTATVTVSGNNGISKSFSISFTVNPKAITANVIVAGKVYDGLTSATITYASLSGVVGTDYVSISTTYPMANFASSSVGTGKAISFAGNFTLTGAAASNYTLTQPTGVTGNITVKELVANIVVENKTYDDTTAATISSASLDGIVGIDDVSISASYPTATFASKDAADGITVNFAANFTLTGTAASNYTLADAQPRGVTANITAKGVAAEVNINDKIYDSTTSATYTSTNITGVIGADQVSLSYPTATFDTAAVGSDKPISFAEEFTLAGQDASNYTLSTQPTGITASITAKELTVSVYVADKVYDGLSSATISSASLIGVEGTDNVSLVTPYPMASFGSATVGSGKQISFADDFVIEGAAASNYTLVQPTVVTSSITVKELTVDVVVADKEYDGNADATITSASLVGIVGIDDVTLVTPYPQAYFTGYETGKDKPIIFAGNFLIEGETASNYILNQPTGITATIIGSFTPAKDIHYTTTVLNSNGWTNTDFVITAVEGYKISTTNTAYGWWLDRLTYTEETSDGSITFYMKDIATGEISVVKTENYKIDKTEPIAMIQYQDNGFITMTYKPIKGLFFKDNLLVELAGEDDNLGFTVEYYKSTEGEIDPKEITDWIEGTELSVEANEKFVLYVKITDVAGNTAIDREKIIVYTDSITFTDVVVLETNDTDATVTVTMNGNTVKEVKHGDTVLIPDVDYIASTDSIVLKQGYLQLLGEGEQYFTVSYYPLGETGTPEEGSEEPGTTLINIVILDEGDVSSSKVTPSSTPSSSTPSSSTPSSSTPSSSISSVQSENPSSVTSTSTDKEVLIMRLNSVKALLDGVEIAVDTKNKDVAPFTLIKKTMVPVRFVENLGAFVKYNGATEPVTVTYNDIQLTLEFGKDTMTRVIAGGEPEVIELPTAPSLVEGKTCVPIREVAEGIGFYVKYDSGSHVIVASTVPLSDSELSESIKIGKENLTAFIEGVKSITAKVTSFNMAVGESVRINKDDIVFNPKEVGCNKLIYSSDNENVAEVTSAGKIIAKGTGVAKITISSHNGKSTTVTVTVS